MRSLRTRIFRLTPAVMLLTLTPLTCQQAAAQSIQRRGIDVIPSQVELSYTKGLRYLAKSQKPDGSWGGRNYGGSQPGLVGICVLSFLAHGEDAVNGPYAHNIQKGIQYLINIQNKKTGYIGSSMYNHGFATLALAESYGMLPQKNIGKALKKAVDLILTAQNNNPLNGWRYGPESTSSDTTVAGCQIVALLAARNAGIPVPDKNIDKALKYMASCRGSNGGYGYTSKSSSRITLSAIGSLCYALAKQKKDKSYPITTKYLKARLDESNIHYNFYHQYYMAQALFHADETLWKQWDEKNTKVMTAAQSPDGSWKSQMLGDSGATGFALLSMALNYRLLPIYEK